MRFSLIAHRGGTDRYPELTIAAAQHSLKLGADKVELDIRFTKDGVPVISHDEDALRLFGRPARIRELTAEQYVSLRYASDPEFRPHTLEEVLAAEVAPIVFHIKEGGDPLVRILTMIRDYGYADKVVMGVMSVEDVQTVKRFSARIRVLAFSPSRTRISEFLAGQAEVIRLWEEWVDEETVRRIQDAGKQVWVMAGSPARGTVGYTSPDNIRAWKEMGVNGVLIDKIADNIALR